MIKGHRQPENRTYTDENGHNFEIMVVKHFSFGERQYVLAREREKQHHHHGENCNCQGHHHDNDSEDSVGEEGFYVFETIHNNDGEALYPVSDETLQTLFPLLETMK